MTMLSASRNQNSNEKVHRRFQHGTTQVFITAGDNYNEKARMSFTDLEKQRIVSYNPSSWRSTLFICHGRPPLGSIWWVLISIAITYVVTMKLLDLEYRLSAIGHSLSGSALMFLIVLRTVNGVRKYWEAVGCWTNLSTCCRECASQIALYVTHDAIRARALKFIIVYCVAMRSYLRKEKIVPEEVSGILSPEEIQELNEDESPPVYCIQAIRQCLGAAVSKKMCLPFHMSIEKSLAQMSNDFGKCSMLLYPMPIAYVAHLRTLVLLWLITVIPVLYQYFSWITIPVFGALSYVLVGLENTAVQMEDPFGYDANDLPLDSVCADIQHSILKIISGQLQFEQDVREELEVTVDDVVNPQPTTQPNVDGLYENAAKSGLKSNAKNDDDDHHGEEEDEDGEDDDDGDDDD